MLTRLRRWLFHLIDVELRSARSEIHALKTALNKERYEHGHTIESRDRWSGATQRTAAILEAVRQELGIEDQLENLTPAAAQHAVGAHLDAMIQAIELRASKAEKDAEDLRAALADERHQHEVTQANLRVASAENMSAWKVIERDRARVSAEMAIANRRKAQAETDARRTPEDESPA